MERILRYEKKFIKISSTSLGIMIIYLFFFMSNQEKSKSIYLCFVLLLTILIMNLVFFLFGFFNKSIFYILIKITILLALIPFFYKEDLYLYGAAAFLYVLICLEMILVYFVEVQTTKVPMLLITFGPILVGSFLLFINEDLTTVHVFFILQFLTSLLGIYKIIDTHTFEMRNKVSEQFQLCEITQNANEELQTSQDKVQVVNQKMAEQKFQLELTNKELNRITSEMYIQNELLSYISTTLEIEPLMDLVTDAIIGAVGVDTCSLIIHDLETKNYYYKSKSSYLVEEVIKQLKEALTTGTLQQYLDIKRPHMNSNVSLSDYPFIKGRPVGSIIIIPLNRNNVTYGLMITEHASKGFFAENNIQFFQSIATQINIAVNNASIYSKMEEIATKDGLTGIYNRRHLQLNLTQKLNETKLSAGVLSVSLFDIDKFKNVNDTYGHLFGDEAIKMVARFAHKYAHMQGGFAGRYGGEEFVLVLPNKNIDETVKILEKMHNDLKNEPLYYSKDTLVYINISIGITAYPDFGATAEELLNRADNAMYYAKKHGRGQIKVDSSDLKDAQ